jgi:hypothetical protein
MSKVSQRMPGAVVPLIVGSIVTATEGEATKSQKPAPSTSAGTSAAKPTSGAKSAVKPTAVTSAKPAAAAATPDDSVQNTSRPSPKTLVQARYAALLAAVAPRAELVEEPTRGDLVAEMIGVAHREDVCEQLKHVFGKNSVC